LDENKNLNENVQPLDTPEENAESAANAQAQDELSAELEQVKELFQQELDKATAEAQTESDESNETDEADATEDSSDESGDADAENLCLCCGEREKAEGRDYCEDCLEAMRHYPFKWVYFLVAAVLIYVLVLAGIKIGDINQGFVSTYEGTVLASAGLREDALEKYENATNLLYRKNVYAKLVYMRSLEIAYESGNIANMTTSVATIFNEWELSLPHMKKLNKYYEDAQVFAATATDLNETLDEYSEMPNDELPYDEMIKKISDFENRTLYIGLTESGEEITEATTEQQAGQMSSSNETYHKRKTKYHRGLIYFYKYYIAELCERPVDEKIAFLETARDDDPTKLWLYANDLATLYIQAERYDDALEVADLIYKDSEVSVNYYIIRATVAKARDKDFDKAIEYCDKGIEIANAYTSQATAAYELYRQKALCYLAKGEYDKAFENAKTAYETYNSLACCETYAFCGLANGDSAPYDEVVGLYGEANEEYGNEKLVLSKAVTDLKNGTRTVEEILEQGGYDIYD
jgi:tetratricopeptide (TPR) repeat protein